MVKLICKLEDEPYFDTTKMFGKEFAFWFVEDLHERGVSIEGRNRDWIEAAQWCEENFGPRGICWVGLVSDVVRNYFCFANEDDAFAFRLRWC